MRKPFFVRCYVKRSEDQWVAVCIDLCLAAQGDSLQEAKEKLESQVNDYVFEALTVDREHARALLSRKAPLQNRAEYYLIAAFQALRSSGSKKREQCAFEELVAVPA